MINILPVFPSIYDCKTQERRDNEREAQVSWGPSAANRKIKCKKIIIHSSKHIIIASMAVL